MRTVLLQIKSYLSISSLKLVNPNHYFLTGKTKPTEPPAVFTRNLTPLFEKNADCIGWVYIKDTAVDYPVMHTPSEPQRYLRLNFDKEYSTAGVPFLKGKWDLDGSTAYEFSGDGNGALLLPVLTNTLMDFIKESTGGEFSSWGDIFSNLGDLEGLTEQFQNGGLEGLPIE